MGDSPSRTPAPPPDPRIELLHHLLTAALSVRQSRVIAGALKPTAELVSIYEELGDVLTILQDTLTRAHHEIADASIAALQLHKVLQVTT